MGEKIKHQKEDLSTLVDALDKFGDVIIEIGNVEKKLGSFDEIGKVFNENIKRLSSEFEKKPELATTLGTILIKFLSISSLLEKKFSELSPNDKANAGIAIKEISSLLKEVIDIYE